MTCLYCVQECKTDNRTYDDCILQALDKIKKHYLFVKNAANAKEQQLQQLQQRNDKLLKAMQLLQQEQILRTPVTSTCQPNAKKRRTAETQYDDEIIDLSLQEVAETQTELKDASTAATTAVTAAADLTSDDLNMALNSEAIFDCSSADNSTQLSPEHNESIGETEKVPSPRVLRTAFELRRQQQQQKRKLDETNESNKEQRSSPVHDKALTGVTKPATTWKGKEKLESTLSNSRRSSEQFLKPLAVDNRRTDKKVSLSLKKPVKLKQTRLQLDVARDKSSAETTFCEDVIGSSPNQPSTLRQAKAGRSWMLRVNNSGANVSSNQSVTNAQPHISTNYFDDGQDDEDELANVFNLKRNESATTTPQTKPTIEVEEAANNDEPATEFELRPEADAAETTIEENAVAAVTAMNDITNCLPESDSSSVMILTPATQDIIFLDDTYDSELIESMELMEQLMKGGDASLTQLKRIEYEKIKQLQKTASAASVAKTDTKQNNKIDAAKLMLKPKASAAANIKIKQEKATQLIMPAPSAQTTPAVKGPLDESSDESEDFMPKPFVVKQEPAQSMTLNETAQSKPQKLSLKERYNIDCRDCQQYIDFLGDNMSEKEIMEHLRRCTRHQARDVDINNTPEDFWNPFIATFAENDPRNETLIDERFVGRKK